MQNKWRVENGINFQKGSPCIAGVVFLSLQLQAQVMPTSQADVTSHSSAWICVLVYWMYSCSMSGGEASARVSSSCSRVIEVVRPWGLSELPESCHVKWPGLFGCNPAIHTYTSKKNDKWEWIHFHGKTVYQCVSAYIPRVWFQYTLYLLRLSNYRHRIFSQLSIPISHPCSLIITFCRSWHQGLRERELQTRPTCTLPSLHCIIINDTLEMWPR
jgi:hypothetical protein